ncbi:hypothetical protein GGU11DRAFT_822108 [Lentinula aff. detonsa]|nr:hypothetical protein GGU11DRAFT_822108 [Lentinula aff. detonsa]
MYLIVPFALFIAFMPPVRSGYCFENCGQNNLNTPLTIIIIFVVVTAVPTDQTISSRFRSEYCIWSLYDTESANATRTITPSSCSPSCSQQQSEHVEYAKYANNGHNGRRFQGAQAPSSSHILTYNFLPLKIFDFDGFPSELVCYVLRSETAKRLALTDTLPTVNAIESFSENMSSSTNSLPALLSFPEDRKLVGTSNWAIFRDHLKSVARATGLTGYLDGSISPPSSTASVSSSTITSTSINSRSPSAEEWELRDGRLAGIIYQNVADPRSIGVNEGMTANAMWNVLTSEYDTSSAAAQSLAKERIQKFRFDGNVPFEFYFKQLEALRKKPWIPYIR